VNEFGNELKLIVYLRVISENVQMEKKRKLVYITRKEHFNAAHRLFNPAWTDEQNEAFFGKCANKNYHGHNFDLYVTLKGYADPDSGMVMDLKKLKDVIKTQVVDKLDHMNINEDVDFMKGQLASIENIVVAIWDRREPYIENGRLHCIKLVETERNYVEYFGEE
jgi:6-pyruvoyltetrahydropterin/6-carboxytetrahydropterin synthase